MGPALTGRRISGIAHPFEVVSTASGWMAGLVDAELVSFAL
jgi:hypothetical protein